MRPSHGSSRATDVRPPTDENRRPREPDIRMEETKWDQGEIDRMQSFSAPAVEPGKAPAQ